MCGWENVELGEFENSCAAFALIVSGFTVVLGSGLLKVT